MTPEQKTVAGGAAAGVLAMAISMFGLYHLWPNVPGLDDTIGRLSYALKAGAFAVLPLLAAVIAVANNRFLSEAIDPLRNKESRSARINGRVVENTLQQYVLFLIGTLALSVNLTAEHARRSCGRHRVRRGPDRVLDRLSRRSALSRFRHGCNRLFEPFPSRFRYVEDVVLRAQKRRAVDTVRSCFGFLRTLYSGWGRFFAPMKIV